MLRMIEGYENYYICSLGYVVNMNTGKILKNRNAMGYNGVRIYKNGKQKSFLIHRLIGKYFIKNNFPEKYTEIDHIDGNKKNNKIDNLRWCDRFINMHNIKKNKNNTTGYRNICKLSNGNYRVFISRYKKRYRKRFKTLEEAILYKKNILGIYHN